jgi:hypothetical protein
MASSAEDVMARLKRLESDVAEIKGTLVHVADILLSQSERMDSARALQQSMVERLDRLIEVTIKGRTQGVERLADVERRLGRLEEHVRLPRE